LAEARRSVLDLRAGPLERQALPAALETLGQRFTAETGIPVASQLALQGPRLPARVEEALYRIAQEALVNIRRHAQASAVRIELHQAGDSIQLIVADNGRGFDPEQTSAPSAGVHAHGFGLIGMQERARLLNGEMQISSCPGSGAQVVVSIPIS
jgi:signal transduction histidine kinase